MATKRADRPSLREFDPYADRNGQDFGQDDPGDVARPADLERQLTENPGLQAEAARIASNEAQRDAVEGGSIATSVATEAETPPENLKHISDARLSPDDEDATAEAIKRMAPKT